MGGRPVFDLDSSASQGIENKNDFVFYVGLVRSVLAKSPDAIVFVRTKQDFKQAPRDAGPDFVLVFLDRKLESAWVERLAGRIRQADESQVKSQQDLLKFMKARWTQRQNDWANKDKDIPKFVITNDKAYLLDIIETVDKDTKKLRKENA